MTVEEIKELVAKDREYSLYMGLTKCRYPNSTKKIILQSVIDGTFQSLYAAETAFGITKNTSYNWAKSLGISINMHTECIPNSHRPQLVTSSDSDSLLKEIEELSSLLTSKKNMVKKVLQNEYEAKLKAFNLL